MPSSKPRHSIDTITWIIFLISACFISFYAGVWVAWTLASSSNQLEGCSDSSSSSSALPSSDCTQLCLNAVLGGQGDLARKLDGKLDSIVRARVEKALEADCPSSSSSDSKVTRRFSKSLSHFANGLISVNRKDMFDKYDFGVPMEENAENEDVLMLYDSRDSLPSSKTLAVAAYFGGEIPHTDATDATSNCDVMSVIFVKNPSKEVRQCMAIVGGQYQGYHVQRWARIVGEGKFGKFDKDAPLRMSGR